MTTCVRIFGIEAIDADTLAKANSVVGETPRCQLPNVLTYWLEHCGERKKHSIDAFCRRHGLDHAVLSSTFELSHYRLLALDMDSTLISMECIDELAEIAGVAKQVRALTAAAVRGEAIDYSKSLRARVRMLRGLKQRELECFLGERVTLTPGAVSLVSRAREMGLKTLIVSGGFQFVADHVGHLLGIDEMVAHALEINNGELTGRLKGDVINSDEKVRIVNQFCQRFGIAPSQTIAVGDGANDIGMVRFAGLGVGFRAKPALREVCSVKLDVSGLDGLLHVLGAGISFEKVR